MPITKMLSGRKYNAETKKWQIVTEQNGNWQYCFREYVELFFKNISE